MEGGGGGWGGGWEGKHRQVPGLGQFMVEKAVNRIDFAFWLCLSLTLEV